MIKNQSSQIYYEILFVDSSETLAVIYHNIRYHMYVLLHQTTTNWTWLTCSYSEWSDMNRCFIVVALITAVWELLIAKYHSGFSMVAICLYRLFHTDLRYHHQQWLESEIQIHLGVVFLLRRGKDLATVRQFRFGRLEYDAVFWGEWLSTFRRIAVPSFWRVKRTKNNEGTFL